MEAFELNWFAIIFWGALTLALLVGIVQCGVNHVRTYRAARKRRAHKRGDRI